LVFNNLAIILSSQSATIRGKPGGEGKHRAIYIGSEYFFEMNEWIKGGRADQPGRSASQNAYVHELGNLASYYATGGPSYGKYGVAGSRDTDSGYHFQACVFRETMNMVPR